MQFPGAITSRENASYVIFGAPFDFSTTFIQGSRFGPSQLRKFAAHFEDYDPRTKTSFSELLVHDSGDIIPESSSFTTYIDYLEGFITDVVNDGITPILIGGEHTVNLAALRALKPDTYVCLDAHLDLRETYQDNPWSHATSTLRALEIVDNAVIIGARSGCEEEWDQANKKNITVISPNEVQDWEPSFKGSVYFSIDIDASDNSIAPGTGTPEPFGLSSKEMLRIVHMVSPYASGFDIVEVNDQDNGQAAILGGKLLREFVHSHATSCPILPKHI
jgi:agmatinase